MTLSSIKEVSAQTQQSREINDSTIYYNIEQEDRSFQFYNFQIFVPKSGITQDFETIIRVDAENSESDPDLYISESVVKPMTESESDQVSLKKGSDICILNRDKFTPGKKVYFSVRCQRKCKYTLKIDYANIQSIQTNQTQGVFMDVRDTNIFSYFVPKSQGNQSQVQSINFQIFTYAINTPIQVYLAPTLDFSLTSVDPLDHKIIEGGKSLLFNPSIHGWCTGCTVYFIVSVKVPFTYYISVESSYLQIGVIQDQVQEMRQFNALQKQCLGYDIVKAVNDAEIQIDTYQGDVEITAYYRNESTNQVSTLPLLVSENSQSRQLVIRSQDRQRYGAANGLIYLCFQSLTASSVLIKAQQFLQINRFDLTPKTLSTLILDSKDSVYFSYSSADLASPQQLQVTFNFFSTQFNVPRLFWRVCDSPNPEECYLSYQQMTGQQNILSPMAELKYTSNNTRSRIGIINHNPSACVNPSSCFILISIFNNEFSGPVKSSLLVKTLTPLSSPILLFQQYQSFLQASDTQIFELKLTSSQVATLNISSIIIETTTFNGKIDLYTSQNNSNPGLLNGYDQVSNGMTQWQRIKYDTQNFTDMSTFKVYIAVFAQQRSQYQIKIDALYTKKGFSTFNTDGQIAQSNPIKVQDQEKIVLGFSETVNKIKVQYFVKTDSRGKTQKVFINIDESNIQKGDQLMYNVSYGSLQWSLNSGSMTILPTDYQFKDGLYFEIIFYNKNQTFFSNFTLQMIAITDFSEDSIFETMINETVTLSTPFQQVLRTLLLDSNFTYKFTLTSLVGQMPNMYYKTGNVFSIVDPNDESTYQLEGTVNEQSGNLEISVPKEIRIQSDSRCSNASYSIKGGYEICNMYKTVQCEGFCVFQFKATLENPITNQTVESPILIRNSLSYSDVLNRNQTRNFYLPFIRGKQPDLTLILSKTSSDVVLVSRIIINGHLPFRNWSYPTNTSFDSAVRGNNSIEIVEITNATMISKCANVNLSCVLLLSIIGNSPFNLSNSTYTLKFLDPSKKLSQVSMIEGQIKSTGSYDNYWIVLNYNSSFQSWKQLFSIRINEQSKDADLFVTVVNGRNPSSIDFDYSSQNQGSDLIQISGEDSLLRIPTNSKTVILKPSIIMIGVKALNDEIFYSLISYGPIGLNETTLKYQDLQIGKPLTQTLLLPQKTLPNTNFVLYRYFVYGQRSLSFNVTCSDGSVQVLGNVQPYQIDYQTNSIFYLPLQEQLSSLTSIKTVFLAKNRTKIMRFNQFENPNEWCQFCYYYLAILQNNTIAKSTVVVTVTNNDNDRIQQLYIGQEVNNTYLESVDNSVTYKFMADSYDALLVNVESTNNRILRASLSFDPENNQNFWTSDDLSSISKSIYQSDINFKVGSWYYLKITTLQEFSNIKINLSQKKAVQLVKSNELVQDEMITPKDFVKFYFFIPPKVQLNYTASITIKSLTQGFSPSIYLLRQDIINGSFDYTTLNYPSIVNYSLFQENFFYNQINQTTAQQQYTLTFNQTSQNQTRIIVVLVQQNVTINRTVERNVTMNVTNATTKKNETVTVLKNVTIQVNQTINTTKNVSVVSLNQSYYTMAVYWNNYGMTDLQKAEYQILYSENIPQTNSTTPRKLMNYENYEGPNSLVSEEFSIGRLLKQRPYPNSYK